jgi:hypothetical protein
MEVFDMELQIKEGCKNGDLIVVVKFSEDKNFNVDKLEWVPRLRELDLLSKAREKLMEKRL